jgi:hypothetical protein
MHERSDEVPIIDDNEGNEGKLEPNALIDRIPMWIIYVGFISLISFFIFAYILPYL